METRITFGPFGEEIQEIPLRHQRDELALRRQMAEVDHRNALGAHLECEPRHLVVRNLQKFVEQAELVHQLEGRGVHGVTAEVAEEVLVLLKHGDVDSGTRQQKAQHYSGRSAAGDGAARGDRPGHAQKQAPRSATWWPSSSKVPKPSTTTAAPT